MIRFNTLDRPKFDLDLDYLYRPKIFLASYLGNVGSLSRMLANYKNMQHINTKARKQGNHTVLHFACYGSSNLATIITLTKSGQADCFVQDNIGRMPFHIACNSADPEIVGYFLNNLHMHILIDTPDFYGRTPLHALCCSGSSKSEKRRGEQLLESLRLLMEYFTKEELITALNREDNFGLTPLMLAKYYGFEELYAVFAKLDIDISDVPDIDPDNHGIVFDYFGRTKLMEAAFDNDLLLVKDQLSNHDYADDPNLGNEQAGFRTPLLLACCSAQEGIVDVIAAILADERTNPLISDIDNSRALHFAAYAGRDDVVKLLLTNRQIRHHINCTDAYGMTALHTLALSPKREIMRLESLNILLKSGIDLFVEDNAGRTAYDIAVAVGNEIVAHALFLAMCSCFKNDIRMGGGGSQDGLAPPQRLIGLEWHILAGNGLPNSTLPIVQQKHYYYYDTNTTKHRVSSSLKLINSI